MKTHSMLAAGLAAAWLAPGGSTGAEPPTTPALQAAAEAPATRPTPKPPAKAPAALAFGKIAYEKNGAIHVLDVAAARSDGFDLPERMEQPAWNADGKRFAYASSFGVSILDIPGQTFMSVSAPGRPAAQPSWSGDGTRLVYEAGGDTPGLDVYDTRDKSAKRLALPGTPTQPSWHPAANRLAYVAAVEGVDQVFVVEAACLEDGTCDKPGSLGTPVQVTRAGKGSREPAWSPDGKRLAIERDGGDGQGTGIFVLNADGSGLRRVSPAGSDDHAPAWGGDEALAFERGGALWVMKVDGGDATLLIDEGRSPSWWRK